MLMMCGVMMTTLSSCSNDDNSNGSAVSPEDKLRAEFYEKIKGTRVDNSMDEILGYIRAYDVREDGTMDILMFDQLVSDEDDEEEEEAAAENESDYNINYISAKWKPIASHYSDYLDDSYPALAVDCKLLLQENANGDIEKQKEQIEYFINKGVDVIVIVCIDSDDHDPEELMSRLKATCRSYAQNLATVIAISVEEMESWILADKNAILLAYPDADMDRLSEYEQDSVCGTWEVLCDVVLRAQSPRIRRIGYPAIGQYKATWAEKISKYMLPGNNVSPSFKKYEMALSSAVRQVLHA